MCVLCVIESDAICVRVFSVSMCVCQFSVLLWVTVLYVVQRVFCVGNGVFRVSVKLCCSPGPYVAATSPVGLECLFYAMCKNQLLIV